MDTDSLAAKNHKTHKGFLPLRVGGVCGADGEQRQRTWRVSCLFILQILRHNPPPAPAAARFHPAHACASGRKVLTTARQNNKVLRRQARQCPSAATLQRRKVSIRAASRCPQLRNRQYPKHRQIENLPTQFVKHNLVAGF